MTVRLSPGNTHWVQLSGLTRKDTGEFVDEATVECTVYKCNSTQEIAGETWPVTLTASGDSGYYSNTFDSEAVLEDGKEYTVKIVATIGENVAEWEETVLAKTRRF